jgi:hypothetical protein
VISLHLKSPTHRNYNLLTVQHIDIYDWYRDIIQAPIRKL